jgi:hypothetical protein
MENDAKRGKRMPAIPFPFFHPPKNKEERKEKPMKKLWKISVVLTVVLTAAAALSGWRLSRRWTDRDACAVGVIGAADGPTSILVTQKRSWSAVSVFFRFVFFFADTFSSLSDWRRERSRKKRFEGKAGRP